MKLTKVKGLGDERMEPTIRDPNKAHYWYGNARYWRVRCEQLLRERKEKR